ncbi:response regulator [Ammoniphilus sp. CFH 90114]|uniref:response regulator n=1 Tax=Ammoniphilus sp. CFH 90114 TaxID=2493665 RepID=UPI00100E926F|nr:response regulator [Ammoniphilus sp. CFH 90114]RXT04332.1 response regulator [Ammoniphilus sp. CFH 90114]
MTKILIVDDDPMIRYTLQEICEFAGFDSLALENGKEACERFNEDEFEVVLVDYYMPEMDGLETVRALREMSEQVPILVLTVDEREETVQGFFEAGATDFSLKPVRAPDLISRLNLHLELSSMKRHQQNKRREVWVTKGISENTMNLIVQFLKEQTQPVTIEEITEGVGLAYPTVHRYIAQLMDEEAVEVIPHYRKVGRPKNQYLWKTAKS